MNRCIFFEAAMLRACQETTFTIYYLESLLRKHFSLKKKARLFRDKLLVGFSHLRNRASSNFQPLLFCEFHPSLNSRFSISFSSANAFTSSIIFGTDMFVCLPVLSTEGKLSRAKMFLTLFSWMSSSTLHKSCT